MDAQEMSTSSEKTFLVVNLSFFGDVLLTNSLCQNLKIKYPNCKIVFLVNKPFVDAAKYQKDVDDVIHIDKRHKHRGLSGLIKFVGSCEYRNKIDAAFVVYGNPRGIILSKLLGAKKIISKPPIYMRFLVNGIPSKNNIKKVQDINGHLFEGLTKEKEKILPIKYLTYPEKNDVTQKLLDDYKNNHLVGLCCTSKSIKKDMPIDVAENLINTLHSQNKKVLFLGSGAIARNYADDLKKIGCNNFVDLVDVTTIYDLANILKVCNGLISVDTGTMHLGYAVNCPTICLFYNDYDIKEWAPDENLYNVKVLKNAKNVEQIIAEYDKLAVKN